MSAFKPLTVREATPDDVAKFAPHAAMRPTLRAWVGEVDGKIVVIGGYAIINARAYAFLDITDDARVYKIHLMRAAIRMLDEAKARGIPVVYAEADSDEDKAVQWLFRLGFEADPRMENLYKWSAKKWRHWHHSQQS